MDETVSTLLFEIDTETAAKQLEFFERNVVHCLDRLDQRLARFSSSVTQSVDDLSGNEIQPPEPKLTIHDSSNEPPDETKERFPNIPDPIPTGQNPNPFPLSETYVPQKRNTENLLPDFISDRKITTGLKSGEPFPVNSKNEEKVDLPPQLELPRIPKIDLQELPLPQKTQKTGNKQTENNRARESSSLFLSELPKMELEKTSIDRPRIQSSDSSRFPEETLPTFRSGAPARSETGENSFDKLAAQNTMLIRIAETMAQYLKGLSLDQPESYRVDVE